MKPYAKRATVILAILACIVLLAALVPRPHAPSPQPAPIMIMAQPYVIPSPPVGLLDRFMPRTRSWAWLWRLRYAVLGKSPTINLNSSIIDCSDTNLSAIATLLPERPDFGTPDGMQVWRLKRIEAQALQRRLKENPDPILASPRVTTGDKTRTCLYTGQGAVLINGVRQQVGLTVDLLPVLRKGTTDLTAIFCFSEAITNLSIASFDPFLSDVVLIKTNLDFAGRFQLTPEMPAIFVLSVPGAEKRLAVLLTSTVQKARK